MTCELWPHILLDMIGTLFQFHSILCALCVLSMSLWDLLGSGLGGVGMLYLLVHVVVLFGAYLDHMGNHTKEGRKKMCDSPKGIYM